MALYKVYGTVTTKETYYIESSEQPTLEQAKALIDEAGAEPITQTFDWTVDSVELSDNEEFEAALENEYCVSPWMGHKLIINGDGDV